MNRRPLTLILLAFITCLTGQIAHAERIKITTSGEHARDIQVILVGEPQPGGKLPVIYVFDMESNLNTVHGAVEVLQRADKMPPVLLVGIPTNDRVFDYTPTPSEDVPSPTGGAGALLDVLHGDIIPYIKQHYPVSDFTVLHGHSLSGLFATHAMLSSPDQFSGVIAIGPSLWWDDSSTSARAAQNCVSNNYRRLFLSLSDEVDSRPGTEQMAQACAREEGPDGGTILREYPDKDHVTAVTPGTQDGLLFVFKEWNFDAIVEARDVDAVFEKLALLESLTGGKPHINYPQMARLARSFTSEGDPATAIRLLEIVNEAAPKKTMVLNFLGEAYKAAGEHETACRTFLESYAVAQEVNSPMTAWIEAQIDELNANAGCVAQSP